MNTLTDQEKDKEKDYIIALYKEKENHSITKER